MFCLFIHKRTNSQKLSTQSLYKKKKIYFCKKQETLCDMQKTKQLKVVLGGNGNLAWHLGYALQKNGIEILQIYGRNQTHIQAFAKEWKVPHTHLLEQLTPHADMYIFALKDDAYAELCSTFPFRNACMVHTSGSVDNAIFQSLTPHGGVLYPFQTFTKGIELNFRDIPLCVDSHDSDCEQNVLLLANKLSDHVYRINSNQRKSLHLSGVFACNFVNAMYYLAKNMAAENEIDFALLRPLIAETARKVQMHLPEEVQTGPAIRSDQSIMSAHLEWLKDPQLKDLYVSISDIIFKMQKTK
jgi:predicted short-subunit dehydrogenase-like oxidoreductase (DUF2520 family)